MDQPVTYRVLWNASYALSFFALDILACLYPSVIPPFAVPPLIAELLCRPFYKYRNLSLLMESLVRLRWIILAGVATYYWYVIPYVYKYQNHQMWGTEALVGSIASGIQFIICIVVLFVFRKFKKRADKNVTAQAS